MKRFAFKLLVFLLLGAIINVAVAWAVAGRRSSLKLTGLGNFARDGRIHFVQVFKTATEHQIRTTAGPKAAGYIQPTLSRAEFVVKESDIPRWCFLNNVGSQQAAPKDWHAIDSAFGWPLQSMNHQLLGDRNLQTTAGMNIAWGLDLTPSSKAIPPLRTVYVHHALPLRPLWPGFAINTIFYAAIVWMLFAVPGFIKRRRRIKRGLCARCGYPVGVSETCSECGAAVIL